MFTKLLKPFFNLYVLKKNVPISANLSVTDRCNFRCGHCKIPERNLEELPKEKIFAVVDELKKGGTVKISLCGGEPLIRKDIGEIIDYIKAQGIMVNLVSNGALIRQKINEIKNLDFIVLSYDGSPQAQKDVRGETAHDIVLDAIEAVKENGLKVFIVTVLTKNNLTEIDSIIDLAEQKDLGCEIHPVYSWSLSKGGTEHLQPEKKDMDKTVAKLKQIKKTKKGKHLVFSKATLDYLGEWPKFKKQKCWAGNAYVYVDTDGRVYACNHMIQKIEGIPLLENGIKETMKKLQRLPCKGCWCLPNIEYNYMCSFNPSALWNFFKGEQSHQKLVFSRKAGYFRTMMKLLYRLYELENHIYHYNKRTKACINWFVGNVCASPVGQIAYDLIQPRFLTFPKRVQIETTSYCNAKCEMCPQPFMPRRNRHMEQSVYEKIIKELTQNSNKLNTLSFHFLNEPLMDPRLFERIKLAKDSGIRQTQLNTNAQLLNKEKAIKLIESGIDTVTFSLGGLEPETQDQRRVGTSLSSVEKNIDDFIALINSPPFSTKKPKVIIYTIKSSSGDKAWKPVVKKYKNLADTIVVINQNNWGGKSKNIEKEQNLTEYRVPCPSIFTTMNINVDGKVNLCCVDWEDREIMGDLSKQSISEVWNGKMETYRRMHIKDQSKKIPMCKECTMYR